MHPCRLFLPVFAACLLGACVAPLATAQGENVQEDNEDSPFRPGLAATYTAGGKSITRTDELLAFDWQNAACDPRLPAGEFAADWRGRLWTKSVGSHCLHCFLQGDVTIKLAGKTIIDGKAAQPQWLSSE